MRIRLAKTAGFCFGVDRAVGKVYELAKESKVPVVTLGPIIHNAQVVKDLEEKGVRVASVEDIPNLQGSTVVIRSHGVGAQVYERLKECQVSYVDATCPFVLKIHRIVEREGNEGRHVLIIGSANHPEVQGIVGCCTGPYTVLESIEQAMEFKNMSGMLYSVVSQTTFSGKKFDEIVEILKEKLYDSAVVKTPDTCRIFNTICNATEERQSEARLIAAEVDTMLVVGDSYSSNTQKLYEICREECINTYYINTPVDLDSDMFQCSSYVGITAGASTPKKIIEEVHTHVRKDF